MKKRRSLGFNPRAGRIGKASAQAMLSKPVHAHVNAGMARRSVLTVKTGRPGVV